ncbi:DNA-directed RNA polymerase III subunit RPC4 [Linum grandiflorum]
MDHGDPPPNPRKLKFAPKKPAAQRKPKLATPKPEDAIEEAQKLMNDFNEKLDRQLKRADKKAAPVQVAFSGEGSALSIKKFGSPKAETGDDDHHDSSSRKKKQQSYEVAAEASSDTMQIDVPRGERTKKQYKEPFDYENTYYPITLPLREPNSGDPEVLNEEEFGKSAMESEYDERLINHAAELGFSEDPSEDPKMFLFKFPPSLPLKKQSKKTKAGSSKVDSDLSQLPEGRMGKMVIYKSGAVKWKIGDVDYDVSQGLDCTFAQEVAAMNTTTKQCSSVGEVEKHAVVSVDVDSILDSVINLD